MKATNLKKEMDKAALSMRRVHFDKLVSLGVPLATLGALNARQHSVGFGCIATGKDGLFSFVEDGTPACIVAAVWPEAHAYGDHGIFDLVAFTSEEPARWWLRCGSAWGLGEHYPDFPDPLHVVRTPVDWLAAGGSALCILDWSDDSPAWCALRGAPTLKFDDDTFRQQVRNALVRAARVPPMEIAA